jgi:hypothetical protein
MRNLFCFMVWDSLRPRHTSIAETALRPSQGRRSKTYVTDSDQVSAGAKAGGVSVFPTMTLPNGERYGGVKDLCGNIIGAKMRRGGELQPLKTAKSDFLL